MDAEARAKLRKVPMQRAKGKLSEDNGEFERQFWLSVSPEERMQALFDLAPFLSRGTKTLFFVLASRLGKSMY
jgi:hypothetical protein